MNEQEIDTLLQALTVLISNNRQEEARGLIARSFTYLPAKAQSEIMLSTFIDGMRSEVIEQQDK